MTRSPLRRTAALGILAVAVVCAQTPADKSALTLGVYWVVSCESKTASEPMRAGEASPQTCLERSAAIDQTDVVSAAFNPEAISKDTVVLTLRDASALRLRQATQQRIGLKTGVVIDGQLVCVLTIAAPVDRVWISGLPRAKAESVIQAFRNGAVAKTPPASLPARQAAPADRVHSVGGGVTAPIVIHRETPESTQRARAPGIRGTVVLAVVIEPDGAPSNIRVVRSLAPDLDATAIACVQKWRFKPGLRNGEPVAVKATIEVSFRP